MSIMKRSRTWSLLAIVLIVLVASCEKRTPPLSGVTVTAEASTAPAGKGCDGKNGSFPFMLTGAIGGPYPGSLVESGEAVIAAGEVSQLEGEFTITSGKTVVHGSFTLAPGDKVGFCVPTIGSVSANLSYTASVSGSQKGTLTGNLTLSIVSGPLTGAQMEEKFYS
jgi:hypothetical protein